MIRTELGSGSYYLLACADRGAVVPEVDERNNSRASASTVAVTGPDLVVESVGEPPPSIEVGSYDAAFLANSIEPARPVASIDATTIAPVWSAAGMLRAAYDASPARAI